MRNVYPVLAVLLAIVLLNGTGFGQPAGLQPQSPNSHQEYVRHLRTAEERAYGEVLARYDAYLSAHPHDVAVHLERCRFVGNAFYPENAEYNLKQDELDACLLALAQQFPDDPDVLLYRAEFLYGDSAIAFLEDVLARQRQHPDRWQGKPLWKVYESLANQLSYRDRYEESIAPALQAVALNDTLDLSLLLAQAYKADNQPAEARKVLAGGLRPGQPRWELSQKGQLLLELDEPALALKAFRLTATDSTDWHEVEGVARAFEQTGAYAEARKIMRAAAGASASQRKREALFLHDLAYGSADSALASYRALRSLGYHTDPLGHYRLRLFAKHPLLGWQGRDLAGVGLLLGVVLACCAAPYLWILPIHYVGSRFRRRQALPRPAWGLTHFWLISAAYLLSSVIVAWLYNYPYLLSFFSDEYAVTDTAAAGDAAVQAREVLAFFAAMAGCTALLVGRRGWGQLVHGDWTLGKQIGAGVGAAIGLRVGLGLVLVLNRQFFPETAVPSAMFDFPLAAIEENIIALKDNYGLLATFLLVAGLVPVYEEVIFRGIVLNASRKHILFVGANVLQALLFALIHNNLSWFPFYFAFGLTAGYLRQQSGGLGSGIVFHVTNNALALLVLLR
jgi:membrane protease YdiL (CAAX protease family)